MNRSRISAMAAGLLAVLALCQSCTAAEARTKTNHRTVAKAQNRCPLRVTVNGDIVDCNGWRLRQSGWDNTCFNLDYLPSMYACSSSGRR